MKVLLISHAYIEAANRGKLEVLASLPGLTVGVIYPKKWRTWHGEEKTQNSKLKIQNYEEFPLSVFGGGDGGRYFYHPIQLIISILKFRPDLLHVEEEPFSVVSCQLSVISWLLRIKLTFFTCANIVDLNLGWRRKVIEGFVFRTAVAALAGTEGARERLEKRGFSKRIEVIPQFGVDLDLFHPPARPRLANGVVVGFVGRPVPAKGIDLLLRALNRLGPRARLLVVTSSPRIPESLVSLAIGLGIRDRTDFETNVGHAALPKFFRKMDIFVLPSRTTKTWKEQFGRTLVEAMACSLPVIGSSSGAIPEVIGSAGLVFQEGDYRDLGLKIKTLCDVSQRRRLSDLGYRRILGNYTQETIGERLLKFFNQVV